MVSVGARTHPVDGHTGKEVYTAEGRALCPVMAAISIIGTEWRLAIAHRLLDGPQRFSELLRSNARLNAKTLSATLKYLENAGVVQRTVVSTRPFSVVYSLTEMGLGLAPATRELRAWGERWVLPRLKGKAAAGAAAPTAPAVPPAIAPPSSGRRR
ncbi:MAG: helix-turn-helix transcriptional regulator [Thermoplasmata archaeon]|nr:helix-turn-helix transcriptional regulator [Thermoplasmata archaeon]